MERMEKTCFRYLQIEEVKKAGRAIKAREVSSFEKGVHLIPQSIKYQVLFPSFTASFFSKAFQVVSAIERTFYESEKKKTANFTYAHKNTSNISQPTAA
jgi:hypothetical protein